MQSIVKKQEAYQRYSTDFASKRYSKDTTALFDIQIFLLFSILGDLLVEYAGLVPSVEDKIAPFTLTCCRVTNNLYRVFFTYSQKH